MILNILLAVVESPTIDTSNDRAIIGSIVAIVISGIIGWITSLINGKNERKKTKLEFVENNKKISERDRLMMDQMKGFDNKLVEISMDVLEIKNNGNFKSRLMNSMRVVSTNIIDYNVDLEPKYKHIIMQMAREFEDFAFRFYYSDMRGISHEISPFLRIDMDSRISKFYEYAVYINPNPKRYPSAKGKAEWIYFSDFLKSSNMQNKIEILLGILEKNGLSPDDVIEEFEKFISLFFKEFIITINRWDNIGVKIVTEKSFDMSDDEEIEEIRKQTEIENEEKRLLKEQEKNKPKK